MEFKGKKENRIIKCFWDMQGTIDELGVDKSHTKKFFENLARLEKTFDAKTEIVFMTMHDSNKAKNCFSNMVSQFKKHEMDNRVSSCQYDGGYINANGNGGYNDYYDNKAQMLENYEANHEKNKNDIVFCLHAGNSDLDLLMANAHEKGEVYKDIPGAFIDSVDYKNSFSFSDGKKNLFASDKENKDAFNFRALSHGFVSLANIALEKGTQSEKIK